MVGWSAISTLLSRSANRGHANSVVKRYMSDHHNILPFQPSKWQWNKFKDLLHYYFMLGTIPAAAIITYSNIFIGPATLKEIPEDYEPKYWEYYRHPITRFMAKYMLNNPQQDYEKYLNHIFEEDEKSRIRKLEAEIKAKMAERNDYQAYYYRPVLAKYYRTSKEAADYNKAIRGD